ncbi:hypothetical protein CENSYa_0197 [Cenarchaeum symbiosum A]|uniref:Uncharacterized protein n=1 Tax=Cenarchaeum symbiosum (strain A) TaxID=414004 RepID=A0RU23_CENSY|nr:hypothetical protein CENSYa_0197 [Cenarchaeum symbiosum A]
MACRDGSSCRRAGSAFYQAVCTGICGNQGMTLPSLCTRRSRCRTGTASPVIQSCPRPCRRRIFCPPWDDAQSYL